MHPSGAAGNLPRFSVRLTGGRAYTVVVGSGASAEAPDLALTTGTARAVVVTDSNLERLHAPGVAASLRGRGLETSVVAFPAGEIHKTRAIKESIEDRLAAMRCGRDTLLVAVGGGVATDLAGFVAATWMRGVPWIALPTSLLAMVDAAIGGKTGVDHPSGKNLIGAYHQPSGVLADPGFLATLPAAEFRSGLGEVVKAGVVADASLFDHLEANAGALGSCDAGAIAAPLARAVAVKVAVVSEDELESDRRKILNFGHTIAHAIERLTGYALAHGEAVAIGMVVEARVAVRLGLLRAGDADRIERLLGALGLPIGLPGGIEPAAVLEAAATDKKARGGRLEYSLPSAIGEMARGERGFGLPVPDEEVLAVLAGAGGAS